MDLSSRMKPSATVIVGDRCGLLARSLSDTFSFADRYNPTLFQVSHPGP
jgi:hypothetical protein